MKILSKYRNGNVRVILFDDGTRIFDNNEDNFDFEYPVSMDMKITNKCPMGCFMCHEKSTPDGEHGDIMNQKFIDTLLPGTELALGGGAVTGHPDLIPFLEKLKEKHIFPSITVHQKECINNMSLIDKLVDMKLIYGLGISFNIKNDDFWNKMRDNKNMVVHLIAGIHGKDVFDYLAYNGFKILILGYKDFGRGHNFKEQHNKIIENNIKWLKENLKEYLGKYEVVSFDNLAIKQLGVQDIMSSEQWDEFYQGNDGTHTMYVDMVKKQFAKTSTSEQRYSLKDDIKEMFEVIKNEK